MLSVKVEQRINVKFLMKLGKSATETYGLLKEVFRDECLSRTQVFEWFQRFREGREAIANDKHPGWSCMSKMESNIANVGELIRIVYPKIKLKTHNISFRC